ncbi:LysR family transcriptional regulator [Geminicoccus flavidas]|uniref:LysR family transcriptional regulator n=1 Tax=Geminicoccus flavidas TaxID=2506407 RepID=UPI00135841FF|nr:LysR family transcriptional regulator [Geminicoccus flavidas]
MRLSLRQIRYVAEVARLGSIQAAARSLAISQSSILAAIARAEEAAGGAVFDRRPARGVTVTPVGERFLHAARGLLAAQAEFARAIDVLAEGTPPAVRIGCFEPFGSLFMTSVVRRYLDEVGPVEVSLMGGNQSEMHDWLAAGMVDVAVAYDIGPSFAASRTPICGVPTHAILPASDPLASLPAVRIMDLAERPLVLLDLPHTSHFLLAVFELYGRQPRVQMRTRTYETVRSAVAAGLGVSVLNMRPLSSSSPDGRGLVRRPILDELPVPTLMVMDIYGAHKPRFVRRLIALIQRFFAEAGPRSFAVTLPERESSLLRP